MIGNCYCAISIIAITYLRHCKFKDFVFLKVLLEQGHIRAGLVNIITPLGSPVTLRLHRWFGITL